MNLDGLTVLDLFYVAMGAVAVVYIAASVVERAIENRHAPRRRR